MARPTKAEMSELHAQIRRLAGQIADEMVELRRDIHRHPELGNEEFETTKRVAHALEASGIPTRSRITATGLLAEVGGPGPIVGFRADLDALPIDERTDVPFRSQVPGAMHACGHDAHTAIAVGIAKVMNQLEIPGTVRFVFQPAEEVFPGGAYELVREGVTDGVSSIMAFHVDPSMRAGRIGLRAGPITSSSDRFSIEIEGPGGHTARPHETVDAIHAAAKVVTDLPALLDRLVDARRPFAVVFGQIHGGHVDNVIPPSVTMSGTCRALDRELWDSLPLLVERLTHEIVAPYGAKAAVRYQRGIPPVVNDQQVTASLERAFKAALGEHAVGLTMASLGAEDFSRYLEVVPGSLVRLGVGFADRDRDLHSASFDMDEAAIEVGIIGGVYALVELLAQAGEA